MKVHTTDHKREAMSVVVGGALTRNTYVGIQPWGEFFYQNGNAQNDELQRHGSRYL